MMENLFITFIFGSLATYYVVNLFLFDIESTGPFIISNKMVKLTAAGQTSIRPVNLFDYIRRLFFVYEIQDNTWVVNNERVSVWSCPKCLSFWASSWFPIHIYFAFDLTLSEMVICWFAMSGSALFLFNKMEWYRD